MSLVLSASGLWAQTLLADDTIVLGDQTTLSLAAGSNLQSAEGVVVVRQTLDSVTGGMQTVVTSFEPGEHWLHVDDDSLCLVVLDVDVDTTTAEIRDIAPIEKVPYTFWEIFRWVLLALVLVAIGVAVWWVVTHRKKLQQVLGVAAPVDTRNPHERAVDDLEVLRGKRLWQAGKAKEYHTELTDIVRRFIEESTGVRATDMTSEECVNALIGTCGNNDTIALLRKFFTTADLVKFAKSEPLPHEHEASLQSAEEFVEQLWMKIEAEHTAQEESSENGEEASHE